MTEAAHPARGVTLLADRLLLALLVGVAAWLSLSLTRDPGSVSAVWVGNGIFVGWLLSRPTRQWRGYLLVGFLTETTVRLLLLGFLPQRLGSSIMNLGEVVFVAGMVRRLVPDIGDPSHYFTLGRIATGSTLVACALSGLVVAGLATATFGTSFPRNFITWSAAHVVGIVIAAPFTLVVLRQGVKSIAVHERGAFVAWILVFGLIVGAVFYQSTYPLLFLIYPPLLWGAFRHRFAGVVVGVSLITLVGIIATALGHGPLASAQFDRFHHTLLLQVFIGAACLMTYPIALGMAERSRLISRIRSSEQRYRMLADYSHDVVVRMRADGQRLYVSPSASDILGWAPDELLGSRWDLIHPDDHAVQRDAMARLLASGEPNTAIYRMRHKDGHYVWIEAVARTLPSVDDADTMDIIYSGRDVSLRIAAEQALLASQRELEALARVDSLTGLPNRRQFDERLALAVARSQRPGLPIALLYLDIDHFKQINDTHGHGVGDQVLKVFAERLAGCVRAGDLVARLGGDEFVVLVEDALLPQAAEVIARKLIATMDRDIVVDDLHVRTTTSVGIAYCPVRTSVEVLMAAADAALYDAKKAGRNTYRLATVEGPPKTIAPARHP
jgi:diguanylate cyclase (GGDEF)-like protein/PAS domain S-box-containing protein